jgi:uncharacterized membrane protein
MKATTIKHAAALGALSGMRSMAGLTTLSRRFGKRRSRHRAGRLLSNRLVRRALPVLAIGELIADKLPFLPDRTTPLPLAGRALIGSVLGGLVATEERASVLLGAGIGAVTAVATAYVAVHARKFAHDRLSIPDAVVGGFEDTLVLGLAARSL